ncbi:MAG: RNA 2'-phosphotransferase [Clostridia bacterium]|nr:RNA 2'-phosphotransferase [Clostridia bacterium]
MNDYVDLSKEVSYALRHSPSEYGLELDEYGWVDTYKLLKALKRNEKWAFLELDDLVNMIEKSNKKRHEIIGNKIRALYGHSTFRIIKRKVSKPPEFLYHGTTNKFITSIKEKGLLSQERQYVHLSLDVETAYEVGKRRDRKPIILKIKARLAWENGIRFYFGNDNIWLSDDIPSKYIEFS